MRGAKIDRWHDDFVIGLQFESHHRHVQSSSGTINRHTFACAAIGREGRLELFDFIAHEAEPYVGVHGVANYLLDRLYLRLAVVATEQRLGLPDTPRSTSRQNRPSVSRLHHVSHSVTTIRLSATPLDDV